MAGEKSIVDQANDAVNAAGQKIADTAAAARDAVTGAAEDTKNKVQGSDAGHEAGKAADNVKEGASKAADSAQVRRGSNPIGTSGTVEHPARDSMFPDYYACWGLPA
jgi:hypothetical protein